VARDAVTRIIRNGPGVRRPSLVALAVAAAMTWWGTAASAVQSEGQEPSPEAEAAPIAGSQVVRLGHRRYLDVCRLVPPTRAAQLLGFGVDDPREKLRGQEVAGNITATGWLPGAGLCMYSGVSALGAGSPIVLVLGLATDEGLRAATGDEGLTAATRFAAIRDALTAARSSRTRHDPAPAHRPASYRVTAVPGVGDAAFAATSAGTIELVARRDGDIVEVWHRPPGDPCASSTTPECPALDAALESVVGPAARDLLAGAASSRPTVGAPPRPLAPAPVTVDIGGKSRDVCSLAAPKRVGDTARLRITTTAPSEHRGYDETHSVIDPTGGVSTITVHRPPLQWCAYRAGDHAFAGELDLQVTTSDALAQADPTRDARSQLEAARADALTIAEHSAAGLGRSARPKNLRKLGDAAFSDQIGAPRVTFVKGDTYVEVTRTYGPLQLVTARAARRDLRALEQLGRAVAEHLP
jgi:hypothetical protein